MSAINEVPNPPSDAISSVRFSPDGASLLVSAWDSKIQVYHRSDEGYKHSASIQCDAPILDVCWGADSSTFFAVGIDYDVAKYNVHEGQDSKVVMSSHDQAANKVAYSKEHDIVISTSWDETMHIHRPSDNAFVPVKLAAKPFAISLTADRLVVAMAERHVHVYDLAALRDLIPQAGSTEAMREPLVVEPWQQRLSNLKFMTRDIACMPDGTGFSTGSIEGRVSVEFFDPALEKEAYAFKCHRVKVDEVDEDGEEISEIIHPVNTIAYHPVHGTFATGGGDGVVALWDAKTKRRIRQYPKLDASVAALDFSSDGTRLAVAMSPGFEEGKEEEEADPSLVKVYVRELAESETKGKPAKEK
ncbi:hypothetical protein M409DRAFT_66855 [Zasmidium cellare ATCC 36951]|uniref:Anaphase-promoting complex subunit 4 WD40 domain-containing protein n=1 Tax=Zasmidium cellare ATCC 36951 TaxID=1080233 RepID=A0A6A6CFN7_ZASCE|nr:uncharacterized protein M409DRAFT_66855 [Zasmidium cellare ATCC 36951]KAF2165881.1 hypothetical protein M409DRAFT_66855 [Zasmidium cellare ATCC 36951]